MVGSMMTLTTILITLGTLAAAAQKGARRKPVRVKVQAKRRNSR